MLGQVQCPHAGTTSYSCAKWLWQEIARVRRLGWKIEFRLAEHRESRYNAKAQWESICPNFGSVTRHQKGVDLISVLSSFTAPALAFAMCLRTASVVSSTRVLGRWNLRVAVDTRRLRLYRLRRVRSAANTSSDLIALIAPVKDLEDSQSTLVTTRSTEQYLFKTARRPYLSARPLCVGRLSGGSWKHIGVALDFLVYSQKHNFYCTYVAIPESPV